MLICVSNIESKFVWLLPFPRTCDDFLGGFSGAKILKSEQDFENIRKFPKHNLTNNFVGNFGI